MKNIEKNEVDFIGMLKPLNTFRHRIGSTAIEVAIFDFRGLQVVRMRTEKRRTLATETWLVEDVSVFWPDAADLVRMWAAKKKAG